jgi:hypothetical protein
MLSEIKVKIAVATVRLSGGAGRGRPPEAAARRAGLEVVEKLLTSSIYAANTAAWARSSAHGIVAP